MEERDERRRLVGIVHQQRARAVVCDLCGSIHFQDVCPNCRGHGHGMTDEEYREFLRVQVGKRSCSQMDKVELQMVVNAFDETGWSEYWRRQRAAHTRRRTQTIQLIKREAERVLGGSWGDRLQGFIDKVIGASSIYALDDRELRQVIGWLRRLKKHDAAKDRIESEENRR